MAGKKRVATTPPSAPGAKRRLQTTDTIVAQKLRDNFKGLTPQETDAVRGEDGRTLRERIAHDMETAKAQGQNVVWGRYYYDSLHREYQSGCDAHSALEPPKSADEISPALLKAMLMTQRVKVDRSGFDDYFVSCASPPNLKEICGVLRYMITLRTGCNKQLATAAESLRFVSRLGLHRLDPEKWALVRDWADGVLLAMLRKSRANSAKDDMFVDINSGLVELVLDREAVERVAGCEGDLMKVSADLATLTESGGFGRALYLDRMGQVLAQQVALHIEGALAKTLGQKGDLTKEKYDTGKAELMKLLEATPGIDGLPAKRDVTIRYRGQAATASVSSLSEEVSLKFASALKSLAVQQRKLPKLWIEDVVISPGSKVDFKAVVSVSMLKQASAARQQLRDMVSDASINSSDTLSKLVAQKSASLLLSDPSFKVELALVSELTRGDELGRLRRGIMDALPRSGNIFSAASSAQKLHILASGDLFRLSSRSSQEKVRIAQNIVAAIVDSRKPDTRSAAQDDFVAAVVSSLGWFLSVRKGSETIYGEQAAKELLSIAVKKHDSKGLAFADLEPLRVFSHLLSECDNQQVDDMMKTIGKQVKRPTAKVASASSSNKAPKKKDSEQMALKKALSMFE